MLTPVATPVTEFGAMRAMVDRAGFRAGAPNHPASIVTLDFGSGRHSVLKKATDILDRALGDYLTRVESIEFPTTGGGNGLRTVLSAAKSRLCAGGSGAASTFGQVPRRPNVRRVEHAQSGRSILDQPRHCGARRELQWKHRIRPRLSRQSAAELGR